MAHGLGIPLGQVQIWTCANAGSRTDNARDGACLLVERALECRLEGGGRSFRGLSEEVRYEVAPEAGPVSLPAARAFAVDGEGARFAIILDRSNPETALSAVCRRPLPLTP